MTPNLLLSGLDTLHISYFQDTATSALDFVELEARKMALSGVKDPRAQAITLGGRDFLLRPRGAGCYRFVLSTRDLELRLSEAVSPSCFVEYRSEGLWSRGEAAVRASVCDWFADMRIAALKPENLSRVDVAFDFHLPVRDFDEKNVVTYLAKNSTHRTHQNIETLTYGRGALVVRIYDKAEEIRATRKKYWFHDLWGQKEKVWRVEFQLRGGLLKPFGVRTFDQWSAAKRHILGVIARNRFSIRRPSGDSNRSRWPLHPLWTALIAAIEALPAVPPVRAFVTGDTHKRRCLELAVNMVGQAAAYAASDYLSGCRKAPMTLEEVLNDVGSDYFKTHSAAMFADKVEQAIAKRKAIA